MFWGFFPLQITLLNQVINFTCTLNDTINILCFITITPKYNANPKLWSDNALKMLYKLIDTTCMFIEWSDAGMNPK